MLKDTKTIDRSGMFGAEMSDSDFGFILGDDGELKAVFMPIDDIPLPDKVRILLKLFGVSNPEGMVIHTVH